MDPQDIQQAVASFEVYGDGGALDVDAFDNDSMNSLPILSYTLRYAFAYKVCWAGVYSVLILFFR